MKVGDIVKSYDFVGNETCYYIGEVVIVHRDCFKARTIKQVVQNESREVRKDYNDYFEAPMNGFCFMDEFSPDFQRVQVIG